MKKNHFLVVITVLLSLTFYPALAQDEEKSAINTGVDIFNRYVWRELDFGFSPSIQPVLEYAHKSGLTVGCWGAFSTTGTYNEVDLYVGYAFKGFSITITDYFFPVSGIPAAKPEKYFNYQNETTGHLYEGSIGWDGPENFPVSLLVGTFFYGGDKNPEGDQNYSTYAELGYTFETKAGNLEPFIGFTPAEGLYGNTLGVVNLGVSSSRSIKINDRFELPVTTSLITNPQISNIYFVFGITL
ncbi:MAG: TorF family putative porin [Bacteroidales bacterium]